MVNDVLFGSFLRKAKEKNIPVTSDIYSDSHFSDFYNLTLQSNEMMDDIGIYRNAFQKKDSILEIGSGNGRVFNVFAKEGFDIYGIEPAREMTKFIDEKYKDRVFHIGIEDLPSLKGYKFNKMIIPATTISLFNKRLLTKFFMDARNLLHPNGSIIFDFLNTDLIENQKGKINSHKTPEGKFFYGNDIINHSYVLNIYMKQGNKEKIGYSIKEMHTLNLFESLAKDLGYTNSLIFQDQTYYFLEMKKNGE
jgi:cyclopropane fatty-acyl-phospholipid synthase-like methyltransferase